MVQISPTVLLTKVSTPGSSRCSAALTLGSGQPSPPELPRNDGLVADLEDRGVIRAMRRTWANLPCNNALPMSRVPPESQCRFQESRRVFLSRRPDTRVFLPIPISYVLAVCSHRKSTTPAEAKTNRHPPGLRRITQRGAVLSFRPRLIAHIPGSGEDITVASLQALYYCSGGDGCHSQRAASAVGSR